VVRVAQGERVIGPGVALRIAEELDKPRNEGRIGYLTPREREVLSLISRGMSNKEIAAELVVSLRTVENHVRNLLGKLEMHSRHEARVYAKALGLETLPRS
jgi:DNA-binding NarL/FixJ family response regulator